MRAPALACTSINRAAQHFGFADGFFCRGRGAAFGLRLPASEITKQYPAGYDVFIALENGKADDKSLILACQRAMQARAPCDVVVTIDSDHSPFLSTPEVLTNALLAVMRRFDRAQARN